MKKLLIFIGCSFWLNIILQAQQKITFSSQNFAGIVTGETGSKLQLQTINGIRKGPWFSGVGTGIDWYYRRSIPVFLSVSRDLFTKNKRSFMLAADAGMNFSWPGQIYYDYPPYGQKQKNGLYWAAGAGYKFGVGKSGNGVLMQLGYSYKQMGEETSYVAPCLIPPCPETVTTYDYRLKRLSFKIGWGF
jgi:hypothetical protein